MNWHSFFTMDTLRRPRARARIMVGGGWFNPHPGWGSAIELGMSKRTRMPT
jgi:hypothetical protein